MSNNVTSKDVDVINSLARWYARDNDQNALLSVAEFLVLCVNLSESQTVFFWWTEGTRDYAQDEEAIVEMRKALIAKFTEISSQELHAL